MAHPLTDTAVGARLDRAPWQRLHTAILLALGAGWLFDSFEVQIFSSAIGPLGDHFHASVFQRDAVLAVWLGGILLGAVTGGRLADRFGRRRLFVATLLWYAGFTVLTGLSPTLAAVYGLRFLAALGVGAEYAIINAAIAEFMRARVRGKANAAVMNFWPAGAIAAALLAFLALDTLALSSAVSWRYMFVLGGLLALVVLYFRRRLPESPRWLVAHGRPTEAEAILRNLEAHPTHGPEEAMLATCTSCTAPRWRSTISGGTPCPRSNTRRADAATSPDMLLATADTPLWVGRQLVTERFFTARLADGSLPQPYHCAI